MKAKTIMSIYIQDNHFTTYCEKDVHFNSIIPKQEWRKHLEKELQKMYPDSPFKRYKGNNFIIQHANTTLNGVFECRNVIEVEGKYFELGKEYK